MADSVNKSVEKLLQFASQINRQHAVTVDDLQPLLSEIATALNDLDRRLRAQEG